MSLQPEDEMLDGGAAPSEPETSAVPSEAFSAANDGGPAPTPDDQLSAPLDVSAEDAGGAPTEPS